MGNCIHLVFPNKLQSRVCKKQKPADLSLSLSQGLGSGSGSGSHSAKVHPHDDLELPSSPLPSLSPKGDFGMFQPPIPPTMPTNDSVVKPTTVKIVVTKKQLQNLMQNVKDLQAAGTVVHFSDTFCRQKSRSPRCSWRPTLCSIPE